MRSFYEPTAEHLTRLSEPWTASFSGGKDSSSVVTWIEWLRFSGWITVERPVLVQSDTGVEEVHLQAIAADMRTALERRGWTCVVVKPNVNERLYNRILGIGNTPIHPGITRMRWCTRSTKIDPMDRYREREREGDEVILTGLRYGESTMRDGKIKKKGCAAGGECGIPDASERTYSPILTWTTCQVIDWLNGVAMGKKETGKIRDLIAITRKLIEIYAVRIGQTGFTFDEGSVEPEVRASRFGCIGCPAIQAERHAPIGTTIRNGAESALNELYDVWFEARMRRNRLFRLRPSYTGESAHGFGPIKLEIRKVLFARVMDIQRRAGVVLITPEDEAFIRQCWANKVYPRGWSEADELTVPPSETPLFDDVEDE